MIDDKIRTKFFKRGDKVRLSKEGMEVLETHPIASWNRRGAWCKGKTLTVQEHGDWGCL